MVIAARVGQPVPNAVLARASFVRSSKLTGVAAGGATSQPGKELEAGVRFPVVDA